MLFFLPGQLKERGPYTSSAKKTTYKIQKEKGARLETQFIVEYV